MNKELLTRSLTGIFIVGITLAAIIYSPYTYLGFLCVIGLIGTFEFFRLDLVPPRPAVLNIIPFIFTGIIAIAGYYILRDQNPIVLWILLPCLISVVVLLQLLALN